MAHGVHHDILYSRGNTTTYGPIPAVLLWYSSLSPQENRDVYPLSPRYYREACPRPRGIPAVTAVFPQSPSLCQSLLLTREQPGDP